MDAASPPARPPVEEIKIVVPGLPASYHRRQGGLLVKNADGKKVAKGYSYPTKALRSWQATVALYVARAMRTRREAFDGPLWLSYRVFVPVPDDVSDEDLQLIKQGMIRPLMPPDIDNTIKSSLDACKVRVIRTNGRTGERTLSKGCIIDDAPICEWEKTGRHYSPFPRVEITFRKITWVDEIQVNEWRCEDYGYAAERDTPHEHGVLANRRKGRSPKRLGTDP